MKFWFLILIFYSLTLRSQKIVLDTIHKVNTNYTFHFSQKQSNILSFKYQKLVAITMQTNINKNVFKAPSLEQGISDAFQYDVRTKFHINKKLSFIFRTQLSAVSQIASLGLSFKFK